MTTPGHTDPISEFINFLIGNAIPPADTAQIIANDKINRYTIAGDKPKSKNGVYRLGQIDGVMIGWARSHKTGQTHNFKSGNFKKLTPEERKTMEAALRQKRHDSAQRQKEQHAATKRLAQDMYKSAKPANPNHPYLIKKQIPPGDIRQDGQNLLIPLRHADGTIWNLQQINHKGFKLFLNGGRVKHCFHQIGEARPLLNQPYVLAEGYATAMTVHIATGWPVLAAIQANNLLPVGAAWRNKHNYARFIYAADNDAWTKRPDGRLWNPGIEYAKGAAEKTGGQIVTLPNWVLHMKDPKTNEELRPTDFNDMAALVGIDEVKKIFNVVRKESG